MLIVSFGGLRVDEVFTLCAENFSQLRRFTTTGG